MMQKAVLGQPHSNQGFSLLEVSIGLAVVALVLSALLPLGWQILANARDAQIRNNLQAIGRACQEYYLYVGGYVDGHWPAQVSDLQPYFLSPSIDATKYTITLKDNILNVSIGTYSVTVVKPNSLSFSS